MMRSVIRGLFAMVFLGLVVPVGSAQTIPNIRIKTRSIADLQSSQRALVGQWCRLDYEGARLKPEGWSRYDNLTTIKSAPDFSTVYVISRYQVVPQQRAGMAMDVNFTVIGRWEAGIGYTAETMPRVVTFTFADVNGDIQITDVVPAAAPHVSKQAMTDYLKTQLESAKSDLDKTLITRALDKLNPKPTPPPAEQPK